MFGSIYLLKNLKNSKIYIGQTTQDVNKYLEYRLSKSSQKNLNRFIDRAIMKYNRDDWVFDVLSIANTREELDSLEIKYIKEYDARNILIGYNICKGGERGPGWPKGEKNPSKNISIATRKKVGRAVSKALKGRPKSDAHKAALTASRIGPLNHMWGKKHSLATRIQMSQTRKKKYPHGTK